MFQLVFICVKCGLRSHTKPNKRFFHRTKASATKREMNQVILLQEAADIHSSKCTASLAFGNETGE